MTDQKCGRCGAEGVELTAVAVLICNVCGTDNLCFLCERLWITGAEMTTDLAHISFVGNAVLRKLREMQEPKWDPLWEPYTGSPTTAPVIREQCGAASPGPGEFVCGLPAGHQDNYHHDMAGCYAWLNTGAKS